ncbi:MAG TPA: hypothetical protein VE999_15420 [Gemmataceae bacterium]|jgi:hypothetical protein|nr:hypothetical protein [Gemmataceae bacterium]
MVRLLVRSGQDEAPLQPETLQIALQQGKSPGKSLLVRHQGQRRNPIFSVCGPAWSQGHGIEADKVPL